MFMLRAGLPTHLGAERRETERDDERICVCRGRGGQRGLEHVHVRCEHWTGVERYRNVYILFQYQLQVDHKQEK